jgi:aminopeptidase YwaD
MNFKRITGLLFLLMVVHIAAAQVKFSFEPSKVKERIKKDITVLASDEFEGREAGTEGERKAAEYIQKRFSEIGITPVFNGSWMQSFTFPGGWQLGDKTGLTMGRDKYKVNQDFYVVPTTPGSASAKAVYVKHGLVNDATNDYAGLGDVKGNIFIMEIFPPTDETNPARLLENINNRLESAASKGAAGIILVNTNPQRTDPVINLNHRYARLQIPVIFVKKPVFDNWEKKSKNRAISFTTEMKREVFTAWNVAGYIDNNAETTVVIGGHYDHVGYGGSGSRSPGVRAIHPGADDNASGTAGVIETARFLKQSDLKNNNYIFIAFSAEEKGLIGSRHFVESGAYDMDKVNYMFNYDMLGRVEKNDFSLIGTGSSPIWDSTIDKHSPDDYTVRKSLSGVGGSDHTSFYRKNIPVLFFFSGIHEDYHRPGDTEDKINYEGLNVMLSMAHNIIADLDGKGKVPFSETVAPTRTASSRSGITLGVMPDHTFDGEGMRIQGVSAGRPAQKAGMKDGDIIIRIKEAKVSDIESYMQATGTLRENEKVSVRVLREGREVDLEVQL